MIHTTSFERATDYSIGGWLCASRLWVHQQTCALLIAFAHQIAWLTMLFGCNVHVDYAFSTYVCSCLVAPVNALLSIWHSHFIVIHCPSFSD